MSKNEQIVKIIEMIVRKELKNILPTLVPKVVKEVMSGMIMESQTHITDDDLDFSGNSHKRKSLLEATGYEDYPTMRASRNDIVANVMGKQMAPRFGEETLNVPTAVMGGSGNPIPVDPNAVPDFIIKAMNKNYSEDLKKVRDQVGW